MRNFVLLFPIVLSGFVECQYERSDSVMEQLGGPDSQYVVKGPMNKRPFRLHGPTENHRPINKKDNHLLYPWSNHQFMLNFFTLHSPFIIPCQKENKKCLKESAQNLLPRLAAGLPEYDIASMDPMFVEQVKTSQAGLDMDFRNTTVTGLRHCTVLNLKRTNTRTYLDLKCSVNMFGNYTLGGKLLIMPIEGNGEYAIKIRDIIVKIMFKVGEKTVGTHKYWIVKNWKHTSEVERGVHFEFHNLFNGNRALSEAVHQFANINWREIFNEVAPPIVKAIVSQILQEVRKLFDRIPIEDMVLE